MTPADKFTLMPTNTEIEFVSDEPLEFFENMRCPAILIQLQAIPISVSSVNGKYTTLVKVNGAHAYVWKKPDLDEDSIEEE